MEGFGRDIMKSVINPLAQIGVIGAQQESVTPEHLDVAGFNILNRLYALGGADREKLAELAAWVEQESARRSISPVELANAINKLLAEAGVSDVSAAASISALRDEPVITGILANVLRSTEHPIVLRRKIGEKRLRQYQIELARLMEEARKYADDIKLYNEYAKMRQRAGVSLNELARLEERLERSGVIERVQKLTDEVMRLISEYKDVEDALGVTPSATLDLRAIIGKRLSMVSAVMEEKEHALRDAYRRIYSAAATRHRFGIDMPLSQYLEGKIIEELEKTGARYALEALEDELDAGLRRALLEEEYRILTDPERHYIFDVDWLRRPRSELYEELARAAETPERIIYIDPELLMSRRTVPGYGESAFLQGTLAFKPRTREELLRDWWQDWLRLMRREEGLGVPLQARLDARGLGVVERISREFGQYPREMLSQMYNVLRARLGTDDPEVIEQAMRRVLSAAGRVMAAQSRFEAKVQQELEEVYRLNRIYQRLRGRSGRDDSTIVQRHVSDIIEGKYPSLMPPNEYQNTVLGYDRAAREQRALEEEIERIRDTSLISEVASEYDLSHGGTQEITRRAAYIASQRDPSYIVRTGEKVTFAGREPEAYTSLWKEAKQVVLPKSAVPYDVLQVDEARKVATIRAAHIPFSQATLEYEIEREALKAWQRFKRYASQAAGAKSALEGVELPVERVQALLTAKGAELAPVEHLVRLMTLGPEDAADDKALMRELRNMALSIAPWAERVMSESDLAAASYDALVDVLSGTRFAGFDEDTLQRLMEDDAFKSAYKGALLGHIFEIMERDRPYSAVANIGRYIREHVRVPYGEGGTRELTDVDLAKLMKEAVAQAVASGSEGVEHLRYIMDMPIDEIIKHVQSTPRGATVSYDAIQWKQLSDEVEDVAREAERLGLVAEEEDVFARVLGEQLGTQRKVGSLADLFGPGEQMVAGTISLEGYDEESARKVVEALLDIRRAAGEGVRVRVIHEGRPYEIIRGSHGDIIAYDPATGRRYLLGTQQPITTSLFERPVPLRDDVLFELPEELRDVQASQKPVLVRSIGDYRNIFNISRDIPDASLETLSTLRNLADGRGRTLAIFDWETTTLPDTGLPFYPTEVAFMTDELRREGGRFARRNIASGSVVFRPTEEVVHAANAIMQEINEGLQKSATVQVRRNSIEFLANIGKFADNEILRLTEKIGKGDVINLTMAEAERLLSSARAGLEYLSTHGVSLEEGMQTLLQWMREARNRNAVIIGQNMLQAEYLWSRAFAEMLPPAESYRARRTIESFFKQPRIELMTLSRFFSQYEPGFVSASIEAQVGRYLAPIVEGGAGIRDDIRSIIESMDFTSQQFHRAAGDIQRELAILYTHLTRDLPAGTDIRPLRPGQYVVRHTAGERFVGSDFIPSGMMRPARGVYRFRGFSQAEDGSRVAALFERMALGAEGRLEPTGVIEELIAPNIGELGRRFHEQFSYVTPERAVEAAREIAEDYARREAVRTLRNPHRLAELLLWGEHGVPSLSSERSAIDYNVSVLRAAAEAAEKEQLGPEDELLIGVIGRERVRDISRPKGVDIAAYAIRPRDTISRTQAWPYLEEWVRSPEAAALREVLADYERYRAIGLLRQPSGQVFRRMDEVRERYLAERGIEPPRGAVPHLRSLSTVTLEGTELGDVIVDLRSPVHTERRLRQLVQQIERTADVSSARAMGILVSDLTQRGLIEGRGEATLEDIAKQLYTLAHSGTVEMRPVEVVLHYRPVIPEELAEDYAAYVKAHLLIPHLELPDEVVVQIADVPPAQALEIVERYISENPIYQARQENFLRAVEALSAMGIEPETLMAFGDVRIMRHGLTPTVAASVFETPEYARESQAMVDELLSAVQRLREQGKPVFSKTLEDMELKETLDVLYERLGAEIGSPVAPTWEALGWGSLWGSEPVTDISQARIPVFATSSLPRSHRRYGDLFMRTVGELSDEELAELSAILQGAGGRISGVVGAQLELERARRLAQVSRSAGETVSETLRAQNEAIKEEAARRVAEKVASAGKTIDDAARGAFRSAGASSVTRETLRAQNEAIKQAALERVAARAAGVDNVIVRGGIPTAGLALAAGIGLALIGARQILQHDDRERYTADSHPAWQRATKPVPLNPGITFEEPEPYRRPVPIAEEGGYRIRVRGRTKTRIAGEALAEAVGGELSSATGRNVTVNIRSQDDTSNIDESFAREVFAQLLKYGYVKS